MIAVTLGMQFICSFPDVSRKRVSVDMSAQQCVKSLGCRPCRTGILPFERLPFGRSNGVSMAGATPPRSFGVFPKLKGGLLGTGLKYLSLGEKSFGENFRVPDLSRFDTYII